jgi:hypothetical protein
VQAYRYRMGENVFVVTAARYFAEQIKRP